MMPEAIHGPRPGQAGQGLSEDARKVLDWLRQRYGRGRARVFSAVEIARAVFGKTEGPTPGVMFDPKDWPRVNEALVELAERGLVEEGRLPQGDAGYRLLRAE